MGGWQSVLDPHGVDAEALLRLILVFVVVCAVVWTLVAGVLLRAVLRKRVPRDPDAGDAATDPSTDRRMARVIALALGATLMVVVSLTTVSFVATRHLRTDAADALVIQVRGWQWWWEVTYPDAEPARRFTTANEIHVPVGRPVRLELAAADVIHSFWVPNLAGKQDMIPGRDNTLVFTARKAGVYRAQCAEFCGLQHARMALVVVAEEPQAFAAWQEAQRAPAPAPASPEAVAGQRVFLARPCAACHAVRGTPAAGTLGPDLTHVASRRTLAAGALPMGRGSLAAWIADPQGIKPGNQMPQVALGADELHAITAWLESLR